MPVTCGRTSATRKAVVRPGSWSVMATERGFSVTMLTSAGGGGPPWSLPQAASSSAAASTTAVVRMKSLAFGIARSIGQHATQEVAELGEFFFLETIEVDVHPFDHDGPDLVRHLLALRGEVQVHHAPVGFAAFAAQ